MGHLHDYIWCWVNPHHKASRNRYPNKPKFKSCISAVELIIELKPQANDIKISPNFIYVTISLPIDKILSYN